jgi:hypothetical protein
MRKVAEVGDTIVLKSFCFSNIGGGTGLSNWDHDERFVGKATAIVTKEWEDYECGQRGWAKPDPSDKKLIEYLKRNAGKQILYWSEFDITNIK